jgi:iron complex transport system substrate-binding protein
MIELAGGEDVLGLPGERSRTAAPEEVAAAAPDVVLVMPCGYDAARSAEEARAHAPLVRSLEAERVVAVDAAAYFSRPGPRLIDGVELLAQLLHPDGAVAPPPPERAIDLSTELAAGHGRAASAPVRE